MSLMSYGHEGQDKDPILYIKEREETILTPFVAGLSFDSGHWKVRGLWRMVHDGAAILYSVVFQD